MSEEDEDAGLHQEVKEPLETPLPDIEGCEYLVAFLHEAGTVSSNGMGITGLSWGEIESWVRMSGRELTVWEIGMVRKLSVAYAGEYSSASNPRKQAPFVVQTNEDLHKNRQAIANKAAAIFSALSQK